MRPDLLAAAPAGARRPGPASRSRSWRPPAPPTSAASTRSPRSPTLCAAHGVWLHVDAAYGCGLLVSRRRASLLDGIERADSVTVDFHKTFFQPVSSSAVLVRDGATLDHVTHHADYLNPDGPPSRPNQVDKSLQTTRRFDALKLWLTLRMMGADAVGELFDRVVDLADEAWAPTASRDPSFEVVAAPAAQPAGLPLRRRRTSTKRRSTARNLACYADALFAGGAPWSPPPRSTAATTSSSRCSTRAPRSTTSPTCSSWSAGRARGWPDARRDPTGATRGAMPRRAHVHDVIGIGLGPFNLGLGLPHRPDRRRSTPSSSRPSRRVSTGTRA